MLTHSSQAGGQVIVSPTVLPVAKAARPATVLDKGGATIINLNSTSGADAPIWDGSMPSSVWIGENDPAPQFSGLTVKRLEQPYMRYIGDSFDVGVVTGFATCCFLVRSSALGAKCCAA